VNTSYRYNRLRTDNQESVYTQNILPTTVNYRNKFTNSIGLNQQHAASGKWEWKPDSLTSFKFTTAGSYKETDVLAAHVRSEFLNGNKELVNNSDQDRSSQTTRAKWDNQLQYKQLFKKPNRQLITTLRFGLTDDHQKSMNNTVTNFYNGGNIDSTDVIDQMLLFDGNSKTLGAKFTYSEPLSKKLNLILDYAHNRNNATSYRNTYNKSSNGKYESLDPVFSNNFDVNAFSNSGMALLKFTDKKLKGVVGSGISTVNLKLHNIDNGTHNNYNFFNYTPQAQIAYSPKAQTNLSFNYRGTTQQPNINQLQPIRNNDDPLYQFQGNPNLKVGFNHNLRLMFNQFKMLKQRGLWMMVNYDIYQNAITNYTTIDTTLGKQVYMPVNVNGNQNWNFWTDWNKWGGEKKWGFSIGLNGNGGINNTFIQQNGVAVKNRTDYKTFNLSIGTNYQEEKKKSIDIRPTIGYNMSVSSIQSNVKNNYFTYGGNISGFIALPWKMELSSDVNFDFRQKLTNFPAPQNFTIWNASLSKAVFKKKTGKFILDANDILNQNRGFNRIINSSFVQEERYNRVSRYVLLRFEWTFNKMPNGTATK